MAGRTYSNQSDRSLPVTVVSRKTGKPNPKKTRRLRKNTATAVYAQEAARQAGASPLGIFSPRGAIIRGVQALQSIGSSDRARATRGGIKANRIIQERKKRK